MAKLKINPLADRVVVQPAEAEEKTKGGINLPDTAKEKPVEGTIVYGTRVLVSNMTGRVSKVTATLRGLSHMFPDDLDILLVGPLEQKVMLMSDAGGSAPISDLTLTFDQNATWTLSDAGAIQFSRAYKPVDFDAGETMPSPAPAGPYSSVLTSFDRTNPNGTWTLKISNAGATRGLFSSAPLPLTTASCNFGDTTVEAESQHHASVNDTPAAARRAS